MHLFYVWDPIALTSKNMDLKIQIINKNIKVIDLTDSCENQGSIKILFFANFGPFPWYAFLV